MVQYLRIAVLKQLVLEKWIKERKNVKETVKICVGH
jgi:hypothetical protein